MNKTEFLSCLEKKLLGLPEHEVAKTKGFYLEMIDDRIEDGMNEEEAVSAMGNVDDIAKEAMLELPLTTLMKTKMKPKTRLKAWEIVLLVLGFPLWFTLLAAFVVVILSVYLSVWVVIISLYVSVAAILFSGIAGVFGSLFLIFQNFDAAVFLLGSGLMCLGISILALFGVTILSVWLVKLTGLFLRWVKSLFISREVDYEITY
ncbi:DUF1700 domain-containing protein [Acetobacterium fimetarium]|uniref:DUF1700 domain-containing protein n=1 Tax=Acetobacterium fimetarium TaxID=52691 RepID=A0ABR6WQZ2_9FIRM|nr:DUF1700 domain-containing protein [Acetobacterium fimetarium]MBC3802920.1 DUF1700 domain-containing protein [Acetobacterium fimetarium]